MTSVAFYEVLIGGVALERCTELAISARNTRWSVARGGVEYGRGHYRVMVLLHAAFLAGAAIEPIVLRRAFIPWLGWAALALALACQMVRWWCVAALGSRWNTRILVVPGLPLVTTGPYRWLRHPNYVAVAVEGMALPLVHVAWITAFSFSAANCVLLTRRIRCENIALGRVTHSGAPSSGRHDIERAATA